MFFVKNEHTTQSINTHTCLTFVDKGHCRQYSNWAPRFLIPAMVAYCVLYIACCMVYIVLSAIYYVSHIVQIVCCILNVLCCALYIVQIVCCTFCTAQCKYCCVK